MDVVITLLVVISALLLALLMVSAGIRSSLRRLEGRLGQSMPARDSSPFQPAADEAEARESAFEAFLAEDPKRMAMAKSEQFSAFRQWRRDKGMN